jgi:hypothetical protein
MNEDIRSASDMRKLCHKQIMEIFSQFAVELPITGSFFASKRGKGC